MAYQLFCAILVGLGLIEVTMSVEPLNSTVVCGYQTDRYLVNGEQICQTCNYDGWEYINGTESVASHCRKLCNVTNPNCERNTICKELSANYSACICAKGYILSQYGKCEDIDECEGEKSPCEDNQKCVNSPGSYTCQCVPIDGASVCFDKGITPGSPTGNDPNYPLIGGIIGGVIFIILLLIVVCCSCRKAKKRRSEKIRHAEVEAGRVQSEAQKTDKEQAYLKPVSHVTSPQDEAGGGQQLHPDDESHDESKDVVPELNTRETKITNQNSNRINELYSNNKILKKSTEQATSLTQE